MMKRLFLAVLAACALHAPAFGQAWTTSERTVTWAVPQVTGDGVDRDAETSTSTQGGDPPALAYEPADIDEGANYTRTEWNNGTPSYTDAAGDNKARFNCNWSHFGEFDPILFPGQPNTGHHHTFIGNKNTDENSDYESLRTNPASTCSGGPLNATAYWAPTLYLTLAPGIYAPVKPNIVTFYYTLDTVDSPLTYRLLNDVAFIGGVNPADPGAVARLAEIPDGAGWDKDANEIAALSGFNGWACFKNNTIVQPDSADAGLELVDGYVRSLRNPSDDTDPWGGACEKSVASDDLILLASVVAPSCWDGYNLRAGAGVANTGAGRDHFRYPIRKADNSYVRICPSGWWRVPKFETKAEYGISGWAEIQNMFLSSDRHGLAEINWHEPGSTYHFDWMGAWDRTTMNTWLGACVGVDINGVAGVDDRNCNDSTISTTLKMLVASASPDPTMSNDPIITQTNLEELASTVRFGTLHVDDGTTVDVTIDHSGH